MTKEERELLFKDLCARLPYKVKVYGNYRYSNGDEIVDDKKIKAIDLSSLDWFVNGIDIKPYLRPLSSMTEEEKKELLTLLVGEDSISHFKVENDGIANTDENIQFGHSWQYHWLNFSNENMSLYADWLNSHHFDYRGLIGKGLALEAPEWMYKSMKLVSYMYSYSGDGGLCLSNRKEWDASEGHLYFDADKWTMEKIYDSVKTLYRKYESLGHTWTLGEVIDHIRDTMVPFINETDGVYRDRMGSWESVREEKRIDPREYETIPWELNGRTCNLDYDK